MVAVYNDFACGLFCCPQRRKCTEAGENWSNTGEKKQLTWCLKVREEAMLDARFGFHGEGVVWAGGT